MNRSPRLPVLLAAASALALVLAACGSAVAPSPTPRPAPASPGTSAPSPSQPVSPAPTDPGQGNVDTHYPELAVELRDGYRVSVTDPAAKAWRIEVRGIGLEAADRIELIVEVGDTAPGAEARFYVRGALVDVLSLGGMIGRGTVAAGGCHPTLELCLGTDTMSVDPVTGTLTASFEALSPVRAEIQGATADWPGEPFILGPWRTTEPFSAT